MNRTLYTELGLRDKENKYIHDFTQRKQVKLPSHTVLDECYAYVRNHRTSFITAAIPDANLRVKIFI